MRNRNIIIVVFTILVLTALFWKHLPLEFTRKIRASDLNDEANAIIIQMYKNEATVNSIDHGIELLEQAIQLDSNNTTYITNLMKLYRNKKEFQKNLALTNKLISINPNDAVVYLHRGLIYEELSDTNNAKYNFNKSLNIVNNRVNLDLSEGERITCINIYQHFKRYRRASQELFKLKTKYPESPFYDILVNELPDSIKNYLEVLSQK